jgi:hypothetical protein
MSTSSIGLDLLFDADLPNPATPKPRNRPMKSEDAGRKLTSKGASAAPAAAGDPRTAADRMAKTTMAVMVLQRYFRKRLEVKPRLNKKNLVDRVKLESVLKVALLEIGLLFLLMATLYLQKAAEVDLGSLNDLRTTFVNHFGLHDLKDKTALVSDAKNFVTTARHQPSVFSGRNLFDPCQSDRRLGFRTRVHAGLEAS